MKRPLFRISTLLALFIATPAIAGSGVYKWTDSSGLTHYTQYKPANYESVEVDAPPPPPTDSYDLNEKWAKEIESGISQSERKKKDAKKTYLSASEKDKIKKNCETAKNNLSVLETQRIVTYKDSVGDTVRMSEEERQSQIESAKKQVEFFCN